ncbi:DUF4040 domain-containing protein, partial [Frankia sp. CNm7]|uniref:hydrogen gas-evolving membrane-bound hydrogenase subunit E n=1 Tax=Frankia nepalensis TaxID=1836974 RepID=UPI001933AAF2
GAPAWARLADVFDAQRGYERVVTGVGRFALAVTARTQVGSLPVYLSTILVVAVVVPGATLASGIRWPTRIPVFDYAIQLPLAVVVLASAVAVIRARTRLSAALLLGAVGYGCGALFVVEGAPDLALAQFLVETLSLIAFVFVLRRLPKRFATLERTAVLRWPRVLVAVAVGLLVGAFAIATSAAHRGPGVASYEYLARSPAQTGAANVVNGIIVDFRALDTLGEITVLAVASLGVASLLLLTGPAGGARPGDGPAAAHRPWPGAAPTRSVLVEVTARAVFPVLLVFSIYLLFAGHGRTGGGFSGGLVAGLAFVLRYVAGGQDRVGPAVPTHPPRAIGAGLTVAALTALAPVPFGGPVLGSYVLATDVPVLGHVELVTSLFFDTGVYLVVVGVVLELLRTLGVGVDKESGTAVAPGGGDGPPPFGPDV